MADGEIAPREEYTDITVRRDGKWYTRDRLIVNQKILDYFKKNLGRDQNGIYILNRYGKFSEKGYCIIEGPVLAVKAVSNDGYILEDESIQPKESARVIFDEEMMPLLFIERLEAWAVFGRQAYLKKRAKITIIKTRR